MTLGEFRSKDLALLEEAARSALTTKLNRDIEFNKNTDRKAYIDATNDWENSDKSEEALARITAKYRFNDLQYQAELKSWVTNEDYDDSLIVSDIEQRLNAGLPVPLDFVSRISDLEVREDMMEKVTNNDKVTPPESILEDHTKEIEAAVKDATGTFEYDSLQNIYATQNASC